MPKSLRIQKPGYLESVLRALGLSPEAIENAIQHLTSSPPAPGVPQIFRVDIYVKSAPSTDMELNLFNSDAPSTFEGTTAVN
jgi:hypothetical protein